MKNDDSAPIWFLAQYKHNCHKVAQRHLARQGFQTFLPLHDETFRARDEIRTQLRPLFPGYMFIALDLEQGGWQRVKSTYGITRIVSLGKDPTPVPSQLVQQLMCRCDETGKLMAQSSLQAGDTVAMTSGPFADMIATIDEIAPDQRVWLLMNIMGGKTRMTVPIDQLRRI